MKTAWGNLLIFMFHIAILPAFDCRSTWLDAPERLLVRPSGSLLRAEATLLSGELKSRKIWVAGAKNGIYVPF
jgi:hypothetical protein